MQSNKTNLHFPPQLRAVKGTSKDFSAGNKKNQGRMKERGNERVSALHVLDLLPATNSSFSTESKQYTVLCCNTSSLCDRQWPYAYLEAERAVERGSAGSLVCIERGVRLRSLLFLSHTPPPLIFSEGIPPLLFDSSLSLFPWHHQSLALGRGGTGILKPATWQLSFSPLPSSVSVWLDRLNQIFIASKAGRPEPHRNRRIAWNHYTPEHHY